MTGRDGVVIVLAGVQNYRAAFLAELNRLLFGKLLVLSGPDSFETSFVSDLEAPYVRDVRNIYLFSGRLLWQVGVIGPAVRAKVAVLQLNPRVITVWLIVFLRLLIGRRTLFWGHAWPRKGPNRGSDKVRGLLRSLGDAVIVYTKSQAASLSEAMPSKKIVVAPNALYRASEMQPVPSSRRKHIIYVGRLVQEKKPQLLLDAFLEFADRGWDGVKLIMVGAGPLEAQLRAKAGTLMGDAILFFGHVGDRTKLFDLYSQALVAVSPGYAGLSITQSFGFGVPMLIARDEPHAPEIEAAREGVNCLFFEENSAKDLARQLESVYQHADKWLARSEEISAVTREQYSADAMANAFLTAITDSE